MRRNNLIIVGVVLIFTFIGLSQVRAQEDLLSILDDADVEETVYATAIFKTSRIVNGHSIENTPRSILDIRISHRFGFINSGFYDLFGLDNATIRIGADWGVTDRLNLGLGRSSLEKTYDGFVKYHFLRQSSGGRNMPIGMSYVGTMAVNTLRYEDPEASNLFRSRFFYTNQLLIARKFSEAFSFQVMPIHIHRNWVETHEEKNDVFALGMGGRMKITNRISINLEYYYVFPDQIAEKYFNSFSIGVDIETGGHVFQLHFTNSTSMIDKGFVTETVGDWFDGGIHFGFNISRAFTLGHNTGKSY